MSRQLLFFSLLLLAVPITVFLGVRVRQNILQKAAGPGAGLQTVGEPLELAAGSWPRECPECFVQRFYNDFWPTPFFTRLAGGDGEALPLIGTMNSVRLFQIGGDDPTTWPPPALRNLQPYYTYQLPIDRDGDGSDEILSIYSEESAGVYQLTLRYYDLQNPAPLLERSFGIRSLALRNLAVDDLNGDGKDEIILAFRRDTAGGETTTAATKIVLYNQNFETLWERTLSNCDTDYHRFYDTLAVGDVNNDNNKEIFYGCTAVYKDAEASWQADGKIYAFTHNGEALINASESESYLFAKFGGGGQPHLALGDLDGDGTKEIIANLYYEIGVLVVLGSDGSEIARRGFASSHTDHAAYEIPASSITLADLDNSGTLEIIVGEVKAVEETAVRKFFGRIHLFYPLLDDSGKIKEIKGFNKENGLVWESPAPLASYPMDYNITIESLLYPSAVLVGDVSGDGVNDLVTSWWPHDRVYAFSVRVDGDTTNLEQISGWPVQLFAPGRDNAVITVARNGITLADVNGDDGLELIVAGHDMGEGIESNGFNDPGDDRYFLYLYKTAGRVSTDLEWPVWKGNFGLTGEYQKSAAPVCENHPPQTPRLNEPPDEARDVSVSPTLSWRAISDWGTNCQGNQDKAAVFLYNNLGMEVAREDVTDPAQTSVKIKNLKSATDYQWKVKADNGALSADSSIWQFTTCVPESYLAGDLDCDCRVALSDLMLLAKIYRRQVGNSDYDPALDVVQHPQSAGEINLFDLVYVAAKYGTQCSGND